MINAAVAEEREGKSLNELSYLAIRCAMKVHTELGPGLLESAHEACFAHELRNNGLWGKHKLHCPFFTTESKLILATVSTF